MKLRKAHSDDCRVIAELALIAGEGIPAYFWEEHRGPGQDIVDAGAEQARTSKRFSWRNVLLAELDGQVAGMLMTYRLPAPEDAEDLLELPEFIRPLVELEQCVPESYYVNMLASFPACRNRGVGTALMATVDAQARDAGCALTSIAVFGENEGAVRLYQRLGYRVVERRDVIPHHSYPYAGEVWLLARAVST